MAFVEYVHTILWSIKYFFIIYFINGFLPLTITSTSKFILNIAGFSTVIFNVIKKKGTGTYFCSKQVCRLNETACTFQRYTFALETIVWFLKSR